MKKTILICGHDLGISDAVARKFGTEGFAVALAARSADKLDAAVKAPGAGASWPGKITTSGKVYVTYGETTGIRPGRGAR
jgi:NADP-dependent 3-hydroxy acid dehydrogenase YdfG